MDSVSAPVDSAPLTSVSAPVASASAPLTSASGTAVSVSAPLASAPLASASAPLTSASGTAVSISAPLASASKTAVSASEPVSDSFDSVFASDPPDSTSDPAAATSAASTTSVEPTREEGNSSSTASVGGMKDGVDPSSTEGALGVYNDVTAIVGGAVALDREEDTASLEEYRKLRLSLNRLVWKSTLGARVTGVEKFAGAEPESATGTILFDWTLGTDHLTILYDDIPFLLSVGTAC